MPVRQGYDQLGVSAFYQTHGTDYQNPHERILHLLLTQWVKSKNLPVSTRFLDLACGSGEVTSLLQHLGFQNITGFDPYTHVAYEIRTGLVAHDYSFEAIANGSLLRKHPEFEFDVIICSFAMHLCAPSWLPLLCLQLAGISSIMLILTPHKRPEIGRDWGWEMLEEQLFERVRLRAYQRTILND